MKIRNPFKDYLGRWKDDATMTEKILWTLVLSPFVVALTKYIFNVLIINYSD